MRRIIQDYESLSVELRQLVREAYPEGIQRSDLLSFPVGGGKRLYGIEIRTPGAVYLVKGDFSEHQSRSGFFVLEKEGESEDDFYSDEED